jgi:peptidoglycan hydrolase-like protein with peptidoglycan-binding domain
MRNLVMTSAIAFYAVFAQSAQADDAALILGTERYETLGGVTRGARVTQAEDGLRALGFDVVALPNGRAETTEEALVAFVDALPEAERLLVVLSGRFVTDGNRTWYLTAEADRPALFSLGATGVSVESILRVLDEAAGRAVLVLGAEEGANNTFDLWLSEGIGQLDVPQGVTVLRGDPRSVADFLVTEMAQPEGDLAALVAGNRRISAEGFLPRNFVFMPPRPAQVAAPQPAPVDTGAEDALWQGAVALDSAEAYRNYLGRYPRGRYAEEAEAAIAEIIAEPERDARRAEDALDLNREQRRNIQRNLSLLDHNPRGIDGIFGPGTRSAISAWQQANAVPQTSYLTAEQISRIDAQAARRSVELEAEAERKRQQEALLDRAYWDETGAGDDEPGFRAYLERYPDGLYAQQAREGLAAIEAAKRREAEAEDRAAWDQARERDRPPAYRRYLEAYPDGVFKEEAAARLAALTQATNDTPAIEAARAEEAALGLNPLTARLVEARLDQLGLEPGEVDGLFDDNTRRAIRRYQRDRDLPVTGYLNEPTVVRLLADSIGGILR